MPTTAPKEEQQERFGEPTPEGEGDSGPGIGTLSLSPEEVRRGDQVVATVTLREGTSRFADVDYSWYVNDEEVLGVARDRLTLSGNRAHKGDRIHVVATVLDEKGRMATRRSETLVVQNTIPVITTDLSRAAGLRGVRMEAEDADGDRIQWSITSGPPGVTIERNGTIRVRQQDLAEDWKGELVVVAEDDDGARAEFHIPTGVNAAVAAKVEETSVTTTRTLRQMSEEELEKASLEAAEKIEGMSAEEQKAWGEEAEKRGKD